MSNERKQFRGTILAEDRRTEGFFRELLVHLGFNRNKLTFLTAPRGKGDACAWVRAQAQYPSEVRLLRQKTNQRIFLIAICDGDSNGFTKRKETLEKVLADDGLNTRQNQERIATPVPTWSIETWLLALLGDENVQESIKLKPLFENRYPGKERRNAIRSAAQAWRTKVDQAVSVPSLRDGKTDLSRIDSA